MSATATATEHGAIASASYFSANLATHRLGLLTRRSLLECEPRGQVVNVSDGTPVLRVDGQILGRPYREEDLRKSLGSGADNAALLVFGLGLGHVPRGLRALCKAPIVVYEPDPSLLRTYFEYGPSDLANLEVVCNPHDLLNAWGRAAVHRVDAILIKSPGYAEAFPQQAQQIDDLAQRLVQRVLITKNTYRLRGKDWVADVLRNVELLREAPLFMALSGQFRNLPAFIVGAGPSLGKNIELLTQAKRKGLVLAANSAAIALGKQGIEPHAVACIESIDISEKIAALPFKDTVLRAFSLSAAPGTLRTGKGPLLPFYEGIPQYSWPLQELTGYGGVGVCGSVSTAAFSIAQHLGCSPIVLVGQDMAYTDGQTYAAGTGYETSRARVDEATGKVRFEWSDSIQKLHASGGSNRHDNEPLKELPAWGGRGSVLSGTSLSTLAGWFEGVAALLKAERPEVVLINATEGGASVPGFADIRLAEVLEQLEDREISGQQLVERARTVKPPLTTAQLLDWAKSRRTETQRVLRRARGIQRLTSPALAAIASEEPTRITRCFAALEAAEHALRASVTKSAFVDAWACAPLAALLERAAPVSDDAKEAAHQSVARGSQLAQAVEEAARELLSEIEALIERLISSNGAQQNHRH